jgi:clan AA aspartic protease
MIRGTVNARSEAIVPLRVRGPTGSELDVDVVLDTAFTGFLTLPPAIVAALNLLNPSEVETTLGDGTILRLNAYDVEVEWDGTWRTVTVTEIDADPLLGVRLLTGHEVFIEFVPGGVVDVTAIP